ncbi:GNAT family N-acetyltransferase [Propionicimonas sp.]|uniref:GNAT family N-acetyltransferase n=1 Tax=Propionicimonas sp. TaxID=1955623 RepID=UPI0039E640B7
MTHTADAESRIVEPRPAGSSPWAVQELSDIQGECYRETFGFDDFWTPTWVWQPKLAGTTDGRHRLFVSVPEGDGDPARGDGLAVAHVGLPEADNPHLARIGLWVRPTARGRGVGSALLAHVEREVAAQGRTVVLGWASSAPEPPAGPGALESPTGAGRVPAGGPATRLALGRGYALGQVSRQSMLPVPDELEAVVDARDTALAAAGTDYRLHVWHDDVPARWRDGLGELVARMSTDVPLGDLAWEPEIWDAARVERWLQTFAERNLHVTITAAEHVPTGVLVGYTEVMHPDPEVPFAYQGSTIVRDEHRGRRLGMALKAQNLVALRQRRPGLRRIHTDNAQENRYMLAINVALGYRPLGVMAAWQKVL